MTNNPYFIDETKDARLSREQAHYMKENWVFATTIFTNIIKGMGDTSVVMNSPKYNRLITHSQLPYADNLTGVKSHELGAKINFLIGFLQKSQSNKDQFMNSFFVQTLMNLLYNGANNNDAELWVSYEQISDSDPELANKQALSAAAYCYRKDPKVPIGLNYIKLIDAIVTKDKNGNYRLVDGRELDFATRKQMAEAVAEHIRLLKANARFQRSYSNDAIANQLYRPTQEI